MAICGEVAGYAQAKVDIPITGASNRVIVPTSGESKGIDKQIGSGPDDFELDERTRSSGSSGYRGFIRSRWSCRQVAHRAPSGVRQIRHRGVSFADSTSSSPRGMSRSYSSGLLRARLDARRTDQAGTLPGPLALLTKRPQILGRDFLAAVAPRRRTLDWYFHILQSLVSVKTWL